MLAQFSDGFCPECLLKGKHSPMALNDADLWECSLCRLQANTAKQGMFTILSTRGSGEIKSGKTAQVATAKVSGWVLAREEDIPSERARKGAKKSELIRMKDELDPETRELFGPLLDALDSVDRRCTGTSGFETEAELREYLDKRVRD
jgi:hypothetical protein